VLKFLVLVGLLYAVYYVFFKKKNILTKSKKENLKKSSETMIECTQCKTYISVNEALLVDGKYFCSKECVDDYSRS